jgi:SPP1 gp7 family putative phage head morphogenesis protein
MDNFLGWTDKQIEDLINNVYNGVVSKQALPMDLYESILERMDDSILEGFGGIGDAAIAKNLFNDFAENIKQFSFAKTFQQVNDMGNFILDKAGNQILFSEFKKSAAQIFEIYNNNWLETEFNTAKSITESARQWVDIQENKDVLPLLKYSTVGDGRVRADHKRLDGIIQPVDSPFWSEHYPPNDFNCRCIVEQIEEGDITDIKGANIEPINPLFANNPAQTGEVFSKKGHPYFNGLGGLLNNPIKDILPKPKPVPKIREKYKFKTKVEAKAAIIRDIETNSQIKINKVTVSSELNIDQLARRADTIKELFTDYKISKSRIDYRGTDIVLKSTKKYYGVVRSGRLFSDKKTYISQVNFGDKADISGAIRVDPKKTPIKRLRWSAAVDEVNADLYTTTHEFAHVISTESALISGEAVDINFFKELTVLRKQYHDELRDISSKYGADSQKILDNQYEISLGRYASTNINEFMAEGFTEYKLHSQPSKYAKGIGELIDKYYKQ